MTKVLKRPMPQHEECPKCQEFNTMATIESYTTFRPGNIVWCTDVIECGQCGLRFYVGWSEKYTAAK